MCPAFFMGFVLSKMNDMRIGMSVFCWGFLDECFLLRVFRYVFSRNCFLLSVFRCVFSHECFSLFVFSYAFSHFLLIIPIIGDCEQYSPRSTFAAVFV